MNINSLSIYKKVNIQYRFRGLKYAIMLLIIFSSLMYRRLLQQLFFIAFIIELDIYLQQLVRMSDVCGLF